MDGSLKVIMGGSQSTGSSLLVNILNRHSKIVSGPETYLFMHPKLYNNWEANKKYLIKTNKLGGLKSTTWFQFNGARLLDKFYGWQEDDLKQLIHHSNNFIDFANAFMQKSLTNHKTTMWIEKSPSNSVAFLEFLQCFAPSKVIHTTRNPYDVVASLINRGYSYYEAVGSYMLDTAHALKAHNHPNYHLVKYEELIQSPDKTIEELLSFLNLAIELKILEPTQQEQKEMVKMKGWKNNEKGAIDKSSLNRFEQENTEVQEKIKGALKAFEINPDYAKKHQLKHTTIDDITSLLDYQVLVPESIDFKLFEKEKKAHQQKRLLRVYPAYGSDYPGSLRK